MVAPRENLECFVIISFWKHSGPISSLVGHEKLPLVAYTMNNIRGVARVRAH